MLNVKSVLGGGLGGRECFVLLVRVGTPPCVQEYRIRHKFEGLLVNVPCDTCSMVGGSPCNVDLGGFVAVFHLYSRKGLVCSLWQWFPKFFDHLSGKILSMYL